MMRERIVHVEGNMFRLHIAGRKCWTEEICPRVQEVRQRYGDSLFILAEAREVACCTCEWVEVSVEMASGIPAQVSMARRIATEIYNEVFPEEAYHG